MFMAAVIASAAASTTSKEAYDPVMSNVSPRITGPIRRISILLRVSW